MKQKIIWMLGLSLCLTACFQKTPSATSTAEPTEWTVQASNQALMDAFNNKKSHLFVEGEGAVKKLLPDDNKGARHQKFLVEISKNQVLLFAHNIDLAPRLDDLKIGDTVQFRGEYVYNPKGGVVHWTHKDPNGGGKYGWIKHNGNTYQ